jgi:hypothetical protein
MLIRSSTPLFQQDPSFQPALTFARVSAESTALCAEKGKWLTGKTSFDWELDNAVFPHGTRHKGIFPSLIGKEIN